MAEHRACPPGTGIELADVVRRFGPQYTARYGERMMPSQKKALSDIAACCTPELGGRLWVDERGQFSKEIALVESRESVALLAETV